MNLETKIIWRQVQNGLNLDLKNFFDDWNHQYQLEIIVVYHNMQNEKKLLSKSQDIEFGDKKLIWRQAFVGHKRHKYFFWRLQPPGSATYHSCLLKYAKSVKSNEAISRKWPKTPILETKSQIFWTHIFFIRIGLRHFSTFIEG